MNQNLDVISPAVTLIIKAAIMAARFSGRVRKRSLKRLAAMDADTKDKEILFLKDKVYQLEMQVSILQKRIQKRQKKPRYTLRERTNHNPYESLSDTEFIDRIESMNSPKQSHL